MRFYPSLALLILLNLVIKPVWIFAIDRNVQNTVGLTEYGLYFSLYNLSILFSFLLDWGFTSYINRELAFNSDNTYSSKLFIKYKLILSLVYIAAVFFFALITGITQWDIVAGLVLLQIFTSFFLFFRAGITASQDFRTDAWLSITDKTLMITLCGIMLLYPAIVGPVDIHRFVWLQVGCMAFATVMSLYLQYQRNSVWAPTNTSSVSFKKIFRQAWPYALIILLMSVHYRLDGFLLERLLPDGKMQAGVYASAYRLLDAANMAGFLVASFLLPMVARRVGEKQEIETVVMNVRHLLMIYSLGIACIGIFAAPWLNQLLYNFTSDNTVAVLQYCLPAIVGYSLVHIYGTVMTATGNIRDFCTITTGAVAINILLNLLLIPKAGAKGACIAALASQYFCGVATMLYVNRKLRVTIHLSSLLLYFIIAVILAAMLYWGQQLPVKMIYLVSFVAITAIILMIVTKLFRPSVWLNFFPKSQTGT